MLFLLSLTYFGMSYANTHLTGDKKAKLRWTDARMGMHVAYVCFVALAVPYILAFTTEVLKRRRLPIIEKIDNSTMKVSESSLKFD